jgi:hypothetical protein
MSIGIYRWDAFRFDGKSDGRNLRPDRSKVFTVRPKRRLTVKKWRKIYMNQGLREAVATVLS